MADPNLDAARADLQRLAADLETIGVAHSADLAARDARIGGLEVTLADVRALHEATRSELAKAEAEIVRLRALLPGTRFGVNLANPVTGRLGVVRHYFQPGDFALTRRQPTWGTEAPLVDGYARGCRVFVVSVKDHAWPERVDAFLATVPADVTLYGCYFHEHEGNIRAGEFTAQQYADRFAVVRDVFQSRGHRFGPIHNGLNLVDGKWRWGGYLEPDLSRCDFWGLDCYDPNSKGVSIFDAWLPYAKATGLPIIIGETGTPYGPAQAAWAADMKAWCVAAGISEVCWWHQQFTGRPNYLMTPETQAVWLT